MPLITENLITLKNAWMASHVTDAEFPTPLSEQGLSLYQQLQSELSTQLIETPIAECNTSLSFYPVDCHPLTIRYAIIFSSYWKDEAQKEAIVEYLTQIMFEAQTDAKLYVGFFNGKPAACGMIYSSPKDENHASIVSDIHALPLENQAQLMQDMEQYLLNIAQQTTNIVVLQK